MKRLLAVLLLLGIVTTLAAGCAPGMSGAASTETESDEASAREHAVLSVATGTFSHNFNAFFADSDEDRMLLRMTNVNLLEQTRDGVYVLDGIAGQEEIYNETPYTYDGIAKCRIRKEDDGSVTYQFRLRDDVTFSDGTALTVDDLIFTLYVMLDPAYDGPYEVNTLPIRGLSAYAEGMEKLYRVILARGEGNGDYSLFAKKTQKKFFSEDWPKAQRKFIRQILDHYEAKSIAAGMIAAGYANKNEETGVVSTNTTYKHFTMKDGDKPTWKDFWEEIFKNTLFGNDVDDMSDYFVGAGIVEQGIGELLPEKYRRLIETSENPKSNISGIRKKDDYALKITLTENDTTALRKLAVPILPLHYYGDRESYDYEKHSFGFVKGQLDAIRANSDSPLGAGPFVYAGYRDEAAYLEANPSYWRGAPKVALLRFLEMSSSDMAYSVVSEAADLAELPIRKEDLEQIRSVNTNGLASGDTVTTVFTDYEAFGYIGIRAERVCVNENPLTKQSIWLRRALATALAFYRFASVDAYYGDTAGLIQSPVSEDSWVSVKSWEPEYEKAFVYDIDGKRIYTADMTFSERKKAVKKAILAYLEGAGYTIEDGKATEAPSGASLSYELLITGYGEGDHPSYGAVTEAAKLLKSLGIRLTVKDCATSGEMFEICETGGADLWVAAWPVDEDVDLFLYSLYHSLGSNSYMYALRSAEVDALIEEGMQSVDPEKKKSAYRKAIRYVTQYAVEIPTYQRRNCILYATKRIRPESMPADQTASYNWMNEIEKIGVYGD